jgi:hypothetical protein
MSESYTLNVLYKGVPHEMNCTLRVSAYTYQFLCTAGNTQIILEKDDEGNWRAMEADPFAGNKNKPDPGLISALLEEIKTILQQ